MNAHYGFGYRYPYGCQAISTVYMHNLESECFATLIVIGGYVNEVRKKYCKINLHIFFNYLLN